MTLNRVAHEYKHWNEMLLALNLKPARIFSDNDIHNLKAGSFGNGGEGKEHKAIKKFIMEHPSSVNKTWKVIQSSTEELLPSGDRLDVFFVLSNSSPPFSFGIKKGQEESLFLPVYSYPYSNQNNKSDVSY